MPRLVKNRSISFDPVLFDRMEERRARLMMDRSEYVKRCIMKDMLTGGSMTYEEVPQDLADEVKAMQKKRNRARNK